MNVEVRPSAEKDLKGIKEKKTVERILNKLEEIEKMLEMGVGPATAVEKRLGGNWSPMIQQRAGNYRMWFVEGSKTEKGQKDVLYLVRILSKEEQQKLMGVNINPETFL